MFPEWDKPQDDHIEVSIFGRGNGESIVMHLGSNKWIVVDSLRSERRSVPLLYLETIGVDVSTAVCLVVASHWHDDHIRGLAELFEKSTSAQCTFPSVLLRDEFFRFAAQFAGTPPGQLTSGVAELGRIVELVAGRNWAPLQLGQAWTTLLRIDGSALAHGKPVEIEALSPSGFDQVAFMQLVASFIPPFDVAVRAPNYDENDVSCAMQIRIGEETVVLCADLEKTRDARSGWDAVFDAGKLTGTPAGLIKIPHHGSITGHHDDIWKVLCKPEPIATLTQWARGGHRLPTVDDARRIRGLTSESYSASQTVTSGDRHRLQAVNSVLKRTNSRIRNLDTRLGHVRHRFNGAIWTTNLIGAAVELKNVAA